MDQTRKITLTPQGEQSGDRGQCGCALSSRIGRRAASERSGFSPIETWRTVYVNIHAVFAQLAFELPDELFVGGHCKRFVGVQEDLFSGGELQADHDRPVAGMQTQQALDSVEPAVVHMRRGNVHAETLGESAGRVLEGIEFLVTNNSFKTVLKLIQSLKDQVAINQATMIITVNAATLTAAQLNLLERESDIVRSL